MHFLCCIPSQKLTKLEKAYSLLNQKKVPINDDVIKCLESVNPNVVQNVAKAIVKMHINQVHLRPSVLDSFLNNSNPNITADEIIKKGSKFIYNT